MNPSVLAVSFSELCETEMPKYSTLYINANKSPYFEKCLGSPMLFLSTVFSK